MHCLHIINKHQEDLLSDCLRSMSENDSLLLIEDAVYFLLKDSQLSSIKHNVYCLTPDCDARGIKPEISNTIQACNDTEFVELICRHEKSLSWY